jgi:protein-S-isoprenylcysteine O-methyltransferase Ste14
MVMLAMRIYYRRKALRDRRQVEYREGWLNMIVRGVFGAIYIGGSVVYIFYPAYLAWAVFPLPQWARWVGASLSASSLALLWWVQWALGIHFDTTLHVQEGHKLVTNGPYRWVRHPMYSTLFLMGLGFLLLTANWMIGGLMLASVVLLVWARLGGEEALLIETFGEQYREYMQRSGRFIPKFGTGAGSSQSQGFDEQR